VATNLNDFSENQMTNFMQNFQILRIISICNSATKTYVDQID